MYRHPDRKSTKRFVTERQNAVPFSLDADESASSFDDIGNLTHELVDNALYAFSTVPNMIFARDQFLELTVNQTKIKVILLTNILRKLEFSQQQIETCSGIVLAWIGSKLSLSTNHMEESRLAFVRYVLSFSAVF